MIVVIVRNLIFIVDIHRTLYNNLIWLVLNMELKDQLNRKIKLEKRPQRIISLVPSQTELLFDLGLSNNVVGITNFCIHPEGIRKSKKVVGGTKNIHLDRIISLSPDIILCNKEENTKEIVDNLQQIAPVWVTDIFTIDDCFEMIASLGTVFNVTEKASMIIADIQKERSVFTEAIADVPHKKVLYLIWKNPYMAAGKLTFIDKMLSLNKFENILKPDSRYPEVSMKEMETADLILLSTEPYPFKQSDAETLSKRLNKPVKLVDGEYFSWYGSRLAKAFDYFKTLHTSS